MREGVYIVLDLSKGHSRSAYGMALPDSNKSVNYAKYFVTRYWKERKICPEKIIKSDVLVEQLTCASWLSITVYFILTFFVVDSKFIQTLYQIPQIIIQKGLLLEAVLCNE